MPIRVVLVLVMDHLQHDVDDPLHLVVEEQRDVEDHLIAPLHNCKLYVGCESATRTSTITTVAEPMASLGGRRTMRSTLEAAALHTKHKVTEKYN